MRTCTAPDLTKRPSALEINELLNENLHNLWEQNHQNLHNLWEQNHKNLKKFLKEKVCLLSVVSKMWLLFIIISHLLIVDSIDSNQSFNNIEHNLLNGLQMISNSSLNSSLMENPIQEQSLLSNTSLIDLQNDNNTQQLQLRFRERYMNFH